LSCLLIQFFLRDRKPTDGSGRFGVSHSSEGDKSRSGKVAGLDGGIEFHEERKRRRRVSVFPSQYEIELGDLNLIF
jgi:hypothetical protein